MTEKHCYCILQSLRIPPSCRESALFYGWEPACLDELQHLSFHLLGRIVRKAGLYGGPDSRKYYKNTINFSIRVWHKFILQLWDILCNAYTTCIVSKTLCNKLLWLFIRDLGSVINILFLIIIRISLYETNNPKTSMCLLLRKTVSSTKVIKTTLIFFWRGWLYSRSNQLG